MSSAADEEMLDTTSTVQQARHEYNSHHIGRPEVSKYTAGLLTISGWTPLSNSSWYVLRTAYTPEIAQAWQDANNEVQEILLCQGEERDPELSSSRILYKKSGDDEHFEHCEEDAPPIARQYFDHNSYFRHAGWTDCASLRQIDDDAAAGMPPTMTSAETSPAARDIYATVDVEVEVESVAAIQEPVEQSSSASGVTHGQSTKKVKALYHLDENVWLLLLHKKVKAAVESGRKIKMLGSGPLTLAFNNFFEGCVLQDEHGADLPPCEAREEQSMKGKIMKMHTEIWKLRDVMRKLLEDKHYTSVYTPDIMADELRQYQVDGTVSV